MYPVWKEKRKRPKKMNDKKVAVIKDLEKPKKPGLENFI